MCIAGLLRRIGITSGLWFEIEGPLASLTMFATVCLRAIAATNQKVAQIGESGWKAMRSDHRRNPGGVPDINQRIQNAGCLRKMGAVKPLPLADLGGLSFWEAHWQNLDEIVEKMREVPKAR